MSLIPKDTLLVVADGRAARLFRNVGDESALRLHQVEMLDPNDASGAGAGPSGVQPPESDIGEATFAKALADRINASALRNGFAHLVIVADPGTLGGLRPQLHKETVARTLAEVAKDWTNMPLEQIERALHELRIA
jgi:protein required for attachment to host cells